MSRDHLLFLRDIERSCEKIVHHTAGRSRDEALADELRFDGILFNLHVIGEAVKNLPLELRHKYSDVAWREIAGLRDFIAHAYFALDLDILWDAVQRDIPALLERVRQILNVEEEAPPPG
ncbi:MAG TPA: DUF86 domain-containing protein [Thermoanaerobaculia bacterium]|nr:DUF86 domain-containing protein [Thermoanaerobaculia bacterium]